MALWAIFGRPWAANCTLIERSRTFFLEAEPEGGGGGDRDLAVNDELRADATGGWVTDGIPTGLWFVTLSELSPMGIGSVGLSGNGVLLHLLPCL